MNLTEIFDKVANVTVGVVGDVCIDAYYFVRDEHGELSVETGKKTRSVEKSYFDLGGAANVAMNMKRLGARRVNLFGVVGADRYADIMRTLLSRAGVTDCLVTQQGTWMTHVYNKVYENGQEDPRLDIGNFNKPDDGTVDTLLAAVERAADSCDAVVVNQQVSNGFHTPRFREGLCRIMERHRSKTVWLSDCRDLNDAYGATIHKLNDSEASRIYADHHAGKTATDAEHLAWLAGHWKRPVIMTRGANGAIVHDGTAVHEIRGLHIINQMDTVGAGDAFLAAMAACIAAGIDLETAASVGNFAAGVSVQKLFQTGHPTVEEVARIGESPDYRYNPELADNFRAANYLPGTDIEVIGRPEPGRPEIAIFDHDGTISTLRFGWERIMDDMMVRAILGDDYATAPAAVFEKVRDAVTNLIARTTGVQTLIQMDGLCRLVREFGHVDEANILDPAGYKAIYNKALLEMVDTRAERIRRGKLSADDVTIKGAVAFLRRLRNAGVTLYLASGTDAGDVRREAEMLGYADCFNGGIYGSVGDIAHDPKKMVLEQIMGEIDRHAGRKPRCVVFGDGPVEMREARKRGLTAVGVLSDERQRYGLNLKKRSRLVLGGADVLIPDYSWSDELSAWLGWEM